MRAVLQTGANWLGKCVGFLLGAIFAPAFIATVALAFGAGLLVYGVFLLAGMGVALVVGSLPCFGLGIVILRGMLRG